jgi:membrane fusion protein (multidrug efflux system)
MMCGVTLGAAQAQPAPGAAMPAVTVEAQKVELSAMVDTIRSIGTLRANQSIIVRSEIPGVVTKIEFAESKTVEKGQVLFRLDDSMDRAQLEQAEASLKLAERNYGRASELLNRGSGTVQARDQTQSALDADRAAVALARARLEKSTIRAAYGGVVGIGKVDLGAYISAGQELVSLDDVATIKLDFEVPERFARFISVGQKVAVQADAYPGRDFSGEVATIATRVDPDARSLGVRAVIPNSDRVLRPGLFARVAVSVAVRPEAVVIPEQAIVPRGDRLLVYKVIDGKAMSATVKVGLREYGKVEIVEGLAPGDMVVTAGQQKVQDGTPVTVLASEPRGGAAPEPTSSPATSHRPPGGPAPAAAEPMTR